MDYSMTALQRAEAITSSRHNIIQGEFATSSDPGVMLTTLLGSCVAVCLYDQAVHVGGMNHFLLPETGNASNANLSYGVNSMELLINDLLKQGASRTRMEAKVFGGARMIAGLSDIGERNSSFALRFLQMEGIPVVSQCVGDTRARKLRFWPATGRVQHAFVALAPDAVKVPVAPPPRRETGDDIELF
jgi:chemotaxis protein CheD